MTVHYPGTLVLDDVYQTAIWSAGIAGNPMTEKRSAFLSVSFSRDAAETSYLFPAHYPAGSRCNVRPTTETVAFRQRLMLRKRGGHASDTEWRQ
ncbi:hypothetical protein [Caballeronia fortuita]|uniref:hypothetical protein n=1 Tax=Caballeronia fortuita TaxID=1777138 RepID=UPI0012FDA0CD|nr:hypothetical protein [Caballeronia fortuita]